MKFHNALFLRIFWLLALIALGIALVLRAYPYSAVFTLVIVAVFGAELYFYIRNRMLFYDKTILSILHNDFSSNFPENLRKGNYEKLFELYETLKRRQFEQVSREHVYTSILNNVDTAVVILRKSGNTWDIFLMNDYFSTLFGVPKFSHWDHLRAKLPTFCQEIENSGFAEMKTSVDIRIDERELQTYSIQTSKTQSYGQDYYVILLDSIQKVIEKKEKMAWINLMKIISHELMNTLTPIRSLSQSIQDIVRQDSLDKDDLEDVRQGLSTIVNRSNHLQFFVENYRKLTMLPSPEKQPTDLNQLIAECLLVMQPMLKQDGISVLNEVDVPRAVPVDKKQIEQVVINLLTNSLHALKEKDERKIFLTSSMQNGRVFLTISDTGKGIEKQIQDKIFLPFFTTRKDGAGIGLTLSKNIIEAHGGYLSYTSDEGRTEFIVCLLI
ncbi:sensor histidine kinase [Flavobacterium caeni]|uniref:histidine kinase n=1 Tax=Flavobacterium caeni TaxID=490189 RepID=A0A1G5G6V5_9FLAO|nr:ATP-binding protein [Flavobacterium caeni]SCY47019.1 Histidine kinase-, DNA gyrase B-, and HSP90-like ATPase [Flavobacterium caeni]